MAGEAAQERLFLQGCAPRPVSAEANPRLSVFHSFAFVQHQDGLDFTGPWHRAQTKTAVGGIVNGLGGSPAGQLVHFNERTAGVLSWPSGAFGI